MKLKSITYATALAAAMASSAAQALPTLPSAGSFEDDDKEYVRDSTGALKTSGSLAVGDTLHSVVNFGAIKNPDASTFATLGAGNAVYGVSVIEIKAITGGVALFGPNAAFEGAYGAGAMIALFRSGTPLDLGCLTAAVCEGGAAGGATFGAPYLTLGFGDTDDFWFAGGVAPFTIATDLGTVATLAASTKVAAVNYGLSVLSNATGYTFDFQSCPLCTFYNATYEGDFVGGGIGGNGQTHFIGSGDVLGGVGLAGEYLARSDFDFDFKRIPEPGTLALFSFGLLGLGNTARRRTFK